MDPTAESKIAVRTTMPRKPLKFSERDLPMERNFVLRRASRIRYNAVSRKSVTRELAE